MSMPGALLNTTQPKPINMEYRTPVVELAILIVIEWHNELGFFLFALPTLMMTAQSGRGRHRFGEFLFKKKPTQSESPVEIDVATEWKPHTRCRVAANAIARPFSVFFFFFFIQPIFV